MDNGFKYIVDNGVVREDEYPYKGQTQRCTKKTETFRISGFTEIRNCEGLAIASRPISVAIDATNWSKYSSGVFSNCRASLNHAAVLVGATI